jgi:hypothetical protein
MQTNLSAARQMHLNRAARTAGEAFAFHDTDVPRAQQRGFGSGLLWLGMAAVAGLGLWLGF